MIHPQLKSLIGPDLERPCVPLDPANCSVFLEASIGANGSKAADLFSFVVATPNYLESHGELPRWSRGLLLVDSFSWEVVDCQLERLLAQAHCPTWEETAQVLNQALEWEYDGYQA